MFKVGDTVVFKVTSGEYRQHIKVDICVIIRKLTEDGIRDYHYAVNEIDGREERIFRVYEKELRYPTALELALFGK